MTTPRMAGRGSSSDHNGQDVPQGQGSARRAGPRRADGYRPDDYGPPEGYRRADGYGTDGYGPDDYTSPLAYPADGYAPPDGYGPDGHAPPDGHGPDGYGPPAPPGRGGTARPGGSPSPRRRRRVRGRRRSRRRGPVRRFLHRWRRPILAVVAIFCLMTGWSVIRALTIPGGGNVPERLAEWARGHYLGPLITLGELLTYHPPKVGGKPSFSLTGPSAAALHPHMHAVKKPVIPAPLPLKSFAGKPLAGEGVWRVLASVNGEPAIYGTYLRASSVYTSYVAGIAWMNPSLLRFQLRPGAEDPGPGNWHAAMDIAPGHRLGLLATFNGGFKINASGGGFYLNGTTVGTLTKGIASVVYYRDGSIAIGVWGQTVRMTPQVVGVRQNLHLIVINGRIPSAVNHNVETSWGATLGGSYYVWRSGIGVTRGGQIVFAYGPSLNVHELAAVLQRAGAVTAMQLDINPDWMSYEYYQPGNNPADPKPVNLLPDQMQSAYRYYAISSRDFTAVYAR